MPDATTRKVTIAAMRCRGILERVHDARDERAEHGETGDGRDEDRGAALTSAHGEPRARGPSGR